MASKMPSKGQEDNREEERPSDESLTEDAQQQYAPQYQLHGGYYHPYQPEYAGYGPGYPPPGPYPYPYPGQLHPPHDAPPYPAHFPYPIAPMPPHPHPHPPRESHHPYVRSRFPQISPDSAVAASRGKRRLEGAAPAARRDPPPSSSKKARRGPEDPSSHPQRLSGLPPTSIAFQASMSTSPQEIAARGSLLYRGSPTGSLSGVGTPTSLGQSRYDSSLGLLAKRFVHRLRRAPGEKMDLNELVQELGVQKRRIYDITNVLEGIGLISKEGKKLVAWVKDPKVDLSHAPEAPRTSPRTAGASSKGAPSEEEVKKEVEEMQKEEKRVDQFIEVLQQNSHVYSTDASTSKSTSGDAADKNLRHFMFVRYTDITGLPMYGDDSIVGVKAPQGTKVEIPDAEPTATLQHRMYLNSTVTSKGRKARPDPIRVYLIRPEALPTGGSGEASGESQESPPAASPSKAQKGASSTSAGQPTSRPDEMSPVRGPVTSSYPTPSWGPPGHPPPPMHHHDPQRAVGVTPEEAKPAGTPRSSRSDRFRRHEYVRSTPQRPTPPRTSPPSTPFAMMDGRWDVPPTPVASGVAPSLFSPGWARTLSYFGPPWEEGAMDTPNPIAAQGSFGLSRTHSPMASQQELYNMPLQSPAGPTQRGFPHVGSILSPSVPPGFSPTLPGINYRTTEAQFPLPTLHAEGRAASSRSLGAERGSQDQDSSRSTVSELPDPAEANERSPPGPATRVKPRRRR